MSRGHDGAVVLVVKRCTAKVHHPYSRILHRSLFSLLSDTNTVTKSVWIEISHHLVHLNASHLLHVVRHRKVWIDKEDVLRLEVCVRQFIVVENYGKKKEQFRWQQFRQSKRLKSVLFSTEESIANIWEHANFYSLFYLDPATIKTT